MTKPLRLIVTDTSPLITLALAGELDLILEPAIDVSIPDAVYVEATRVRTAAGATAILDWLNVNRTRAQIAPTEVGLDQLRRMEDDRSIRRLGEAAALEALDRFLKADEEAEALLLFEDSDVMRRRAIVDERVGLISKGDALEAAHLIQSSDHVLDKAAAAGRDVDRQHAEDGDDAIEQSRRHLATRDP